MSSDTQRPRAEPGFRQYGTGSLITFACERCKRYMTTKGRKQWKVGKLFRGWLCRECV